MNHFMVPDSILLLILAASSAIAVPIDNLGSSMSLNATISCDWSRAADIVGDIEAKALNITEIVEQCANICELVFAPDNPDISKTGVFVSSFIQVTLATVFGPLFPIFIWLVNSFSWRILVQCLPLFRRLQHSVYETNGFFCISTVVAAIVLHYQDTSILEITFTCELLTMQLMLVVTMIWSQYGDHLMNSSSGSKLGWPWNLYYLALCLTQIVVSCVMGAPDKTVAVYKQIARACHSQHGFVDISGYLGTTSSGNSPIKWLGVGLGIGAGIGIILCVLAVPLTGFFTTKILAVIPQWLRKYGLNVLIAVILLFYVSLVIVDLVIMGEFRRDWKSMTRNVVHDEKWGYGQTTAVLLWAPFTWAAIKETIIHWWQSRKPPPSGQPEAEMQTLEPEPEPARPPMAEGVPPPYNYENTSPPTFFTS